MADASTSDPANLLGKVIGDHYRVVASLGTGSMSAVYDVEDTRDRSHAAAKVLLPALGANPQIAARFDREAKAMSMFDHRNIVDLRDLGKLDDGTPFLITDLVRGVSLRDVIADGIVEERRALSIARQVLDALVHAHALGVIHRDIKPENIMLVDGGSPDGTADLVKVLDFGVAKLLGDTMSVLGERTLTQTGFALFGSPLYVAPELALGRAVDARIDLYAVGVILFEMLVGKPPFMDSDPAVLLRLHATSTPPTLAAAAPGRTFTPQLEYVIAESLAKQPDHRFKSGVEMIAAIDAALVSLEPIVEPVPAAVSGNTIHNVVPPAVSATAPRARSQPVASRPSWREVAARWRDRVVGVVQRGRRDRRVIIIASVVTAILVIATIAALVGDGEAGRPDRTTARRSPASAAEDVERGHADYARGRRLDALAAYERAVIASPALGADVKLRSNAIAVLDTRDIAAAMVALELLARLDPPARDAIVARASAGRVLEIRRRAFAVAEREGFADAVDRTESWSLDLDQATTCEDRQHAISKLRDGGDQRAVVALRRARGKFACIEREASEAIAALEKSDARR